MTDLDSNIDLAVTFHLTDNAAFWTDLVTEAARIDMEDQGVSQESYSQGQALVVVFHRDGMKTLTWLTDKHGLHVGWSAKEDWDLLSELGATIQVPPTPKPCVLTGCEDPYYATAGDLDLCQHHFDQIKDVAP